MLKDVNGLPQVEPESQEPTIKTIQGQANRLAQQFAQTHGGLPDRYIEEATEQVTAQEQRQTSQRR